MTIDAAAGGALMDKPYNQAYQLIESMAQNHYQWGNERTSVEKPQTKGGMYEVKELDLVKAKLEALTQKMESMTTTPAATMAATISNCELCGIQGHKIAECQLLTEVPPDQVNYTQGNPYNQGPRNHPYLSYKSNNALYAPGQAPTPSLPGFQKLAFSAPRKSNLELLVENFIATQTQTNLQTSEQIKQITSKLDVLTTHTRMLETQIAQVAQKQASTAAPTGIFPGQPEPNPRGHVNAIILRSGNRYEGPADPRTNTPTIHQDSDEVTKGESEQNIKDKENSGEEIIEKKKPYIPPPPYQPPIPYPQRFEKSKSEGQFRKFVELLKKLNITIPFTEAITQMPSYAKFLKEILTKKKKIEDEEIVMLTAECSSSSSRQSSIDDVLHEIRAQNALNQERDGLFYAMHQQQEEMMERMTFMQAQQDEILQNQHEMQGYYHRWESSEEHRQQQLDNVIQELGGLRLQFNNFQNYQHPPS
ncbi:unnamed protein product [Trifolium pratense]|uniref:Uncharacterized protein n=1 Tax=Trifolium pratense TaxID=57577 RepID=A0ACB0J9D2_TRIPR|nr:unnamed protein product [Trifolium pratense]